MLGRRDKSLLTHLPKLWNNHKNYTNAIEIKVVGGELDWWNCVIIVFDQLKR